MVGRVIVAGGSGLVGRGLAAELAAAGAEVVVLSRAAAPRLPAGVRGRAWDGRSAAGWGGECEGAAAVVNLAGENVGAGRWTAARKRRLAASRIESTAALVEAIAAARARPRVLVQGSAVGYYGDRGEEEVDEGSPPGRGFLAELAVAWEAAARPVEPLGVRLALARTGLVLARQGGALAKLLPAFRLGLGGPLASGRQYFPWIHLADEVAALRLLVERDDLAGAFNLAAPEPVRQGDFARALGRALGRPAVLRAPAWALRLALGEMAEVLAGGQRVVPQRLLAAGFRFRHADLAGALDDLVGRRR